MPILQVTFEDRTEDSKYCSKQQSTVLYYIEGLQTKQQQHWPQLQQPLQQPLQQQWPQPRTAIQQVARVCEWRPRAPLPPPRRTVGLNVKNLAKKIVKLTDHTCACTNLTSFWMWSVFQSAETDWTKIRKKNREIDGSYFCLQKFKCEVHAITGNGNYVKMI